MGDWYSVPLLSERVFARFFNHRKIIPLRKLKANYVEKFITVRGTVVKCTSVKPLVMSMDFECSKCGDRIHQTFPDGRCEVPTACRTPKCKSKQFNPDRDSAMVVNWQRIK